MSTSSSPVELSIDGSMATVLLNRPWVLNAINEAMLLAIEASVDQAEALPDVRAIVVRGAGRAFCAGADLVEAQARISDPRLLDDHLDLWRRALGRLEQSCLPTIAAVRGVVVAGGLELMLACDLAVATADVRIGDGHAVWGLAPAGGATQRLPRLIGARRAMYLLFRGDPISAREALAAGLLNTVVEPEELDHEVAALVSILSRRSPASIASMKRSVREGLSAPSLDAGLDLERAAVLEHMTEPDAGIGQAAFVARQEPVFHRRVPDSDSRPPGSASPRA